MCNLAMSFDLDKYTQKPFLKHFLALKINLLKIFTSKISQKIQNLEKL